MQYLVDKVRRVGKNVRWAFEILVRLFMHNTIFKSSSYTKENSFQVLACHDRICFIRQAFQALYPIV